MPLCPKIFLSIALLSSPDSFSQSQTTKKSKLIRNLRPLERTRQKEHNSKGKTYSQRIDPFWDPKVERETREERRQRLIKAGILEKPPEPDERNWVSKGLDKMEKKISREYNPGSPQYEFSLALGSWFQLGKYHNTVVEDLSYDVSFLSHITQPVENTISFIEDWRPSHRLGLGMSALNGVIQSKENNGTLVVPASSDWNMLSVGLYYDLQLTRERQDLPLRFEANLQMRWYGFQQVKVLRIPQSIDDTEHGDRTRFSPLDAALNLSFGVKYLQLFKGIFFAELRHVSFVQHGALVARFGVGVSMVGLWDSPGSAEKAKDKNRDKEIRENTDKEEGNNGVDEGEEEETE